MTDATCNKSPAGRAKRVRGGVTLSQQRRKRRFLRRPCAYHAEGGQWCWGFA